VELELHRLLVRVELLLAAVTFVALLFVAAPYGRHARRGWGPTMPVRAAWVLMELPACVGFLVFYGMGARRAEPVPLLLLALWQWHYVQRTFVYPLRLRGAGKRMPVLIPVLGASFNTLNGWLNATWISGLGAYTRDWLSDPRPWIGAAVFLAGWTIHSRSDSTLIALRERAGDSGYRIPEGGLFRRVSCPNYLGEIVEWIGWAVATWSPAGAAFAAYTLANLLPRALSTHRWYRSEFPGYPPERKALIPFVL
jgi:hypothetical protein